MNSSRIRRLAAPAFVVGSLALAGSALAAARPDDRSSLRGVDAINVQPRSPQDVLDAVKRSAPNQVGLAWQYLRDTGQIGVSAAPKTYASRATEPSPRRSVSEGESRTIALAAGRAASSSSADIAE